MAADRRLSLEVERLKMEQHWRAVGEYVAMSVAAAITFHQAHGNTKAIVDRHDYDDALNIAATALTRLIPVFTLGRRQQRVQVQVSAVHQRFAYGATQLRSNDGSVIEHLSVKRSHLASAMRLVKQAGLPFAFALPAAEPQDQESSKQA